MAAAFDGNALGAEGNPCRNHYCRVFTLRGGRIRKVHEYFRTILVDETAGGEVTGPATPAGG